MSALTEKRRLETLADVTRDSSVMSGADLTYAALAKQANLPGNLAKTYDAARLEQVSGQGIFDDFTRPNSALVGTSPRLEPKIWLGAGTTTGSLITSNAFVYDGVATAYVYIDSGMSDNFALRTKVTALAVNGPRWILRGNASIVSACITVTRDQTANLWNLNDDNGGTVLASFADATDIVANDVVEFQVRGTSVRVFVNGVLRGTLTAALDIFYYTAGTHQGVKCIAGSGFTVDDFYVYGL